jgi:hypothetical protein
MGPQEREDDTMVLSFFCNEECEPAEQKDLLERIFHVWD